jgi:hypothetical protein
MFAFATVPIIAGIGRCEGLRDNLLTCLLRELALIATPLGRIRLAALRNNRATSALQLAIGPGANAKPAAASANCIRATEVIDMAAGHDRRRPDRPRTDRSNQRLRRGSCLTGAAMACSKSASGCRRGRALCGTCLLGSHAPGSNHASSHTVKCPGDGLFEGAGKSANVGADRWWELDAPRCFVAPVFDCAFE